jgi:outer membrane protein OmpA-like peptidoglycan-associated protein
MMKLKKSLFLYLLIACSISIGYSQDIRLNNPSFEDRPHYGAADNNSSIKGWYDCGAVNFPTATPPDIHEGASRDTSYWDNNVATAHGKTYLGLVVRANESWESVSQRLAFRLSSEKCYTFSIYLARSDTYNSRIMGSAATTTASFTTPAVLRIWGGNGYCADSQLLAESAPIDHSEWKEYEFKIEPNSDYSVITLEAFYKTPLLFPYNGHILLDNSSDFKITACSEEFVMRVKEVRDPRLKVTEKMPAHKAKAVEKRIFEREIVENVVDTIVYKRPTGNRNNEKRLELDRKKMSKGSKINIDHLYFAADTSSINDESYDVLNQVYDFLSGNEDIFIEIGGHTNSSPRFHSYCDKLSEARAKAVADYLISKGIENDRITYKGYGKRKPIASNASEEGRKKNQRVEIKILQIK